MAAAVAQRCWSSSRGDPPSRARTAAARSGSPSMRESSSSPVAERGVWGSSPVSTSAMAGGGRWPVAGRRGGECVRVFGEAWESHTG
ncbi:Os02g0782032 [Oryza sativa Japonica Group]|uniref:Os02g0782032 protein n=1 Tax=Oryza sativa subsp. japonica TaxID=39947 RepID=A0A0P0VQS1_ORYSJ|nr:Os02g0782032 [Oryza sativa Japonica Group]